MLELERFDREPALRRLDGREADDRAEVARFLAALEREPLRRLLWARVEFDRDAELELDRELLLVDESLVCAGIRGLPFLRIARDCLFFDYPEK